MIKHNTAKSKELLAALEDDKNIVGQVPQKELFNRATKDKTIIDIMTDPSLRNGHKAFFSALEETLRQIQLVTDNS